MTINKKKRKTFWINSKGNREIEGWTCYNHAAIPTTPPHKEVDIVPIQDKTIWNLKGKPLFARWTTNWNCDRETKWWDLICESPYLYDDLTRKTRKNIRNSLNKCDVRRINPKDNIDDLWRVFQEATSRYSNYKMTTTYESFVAGINNTKSNIDYWGGYDKNNYLIGYKICAVHDDYVEFITSKYSSNYLNLRVSDALNHITLRYYLNELNKKYVTNGSRNILHETNVQNYYCEHFGFKKAYCKLHIEYRKDFGIAVYLLYPFRRLIRRINKFNKVTAVLTMEEIRRSFK